MEAETTDLQDLQPPEPAALIKAGKASPIALTRAWLDRICVSREFKSYHVWCLPVTPGIDPEIGKIVTFDPAHGR